MPPEWDIEVGASVIRRRDIHGGQGYPVERFGGAWYGGIEPSSTTPNVFIFSEPEKMAEMGYDYDGWAPDGTLHYTGEGKMGDQRLVEGNRAIANHRVDQRAPRVFRARPPMATYLGEFELCEDGGILWADAPEAGGGPVRSVVVFRLRPIGHHFRDDLPPAPLLTAADRVSIREDVPAPMAEDVRAEVNTAAAFMREPSSESFEFQRREAALVDRYQGYLDAVGHPFGRKRIAIPGEAGRLFTDLHDYATDELLEAKASSSRESVRAGLGQLLDYERFVASTSRALLVPTEPRRDLIDLLHAHGIAVVWESNRGRFARADPPYRPKR